MKSSKPFLWMYYFTSLSILLLGVVACWGIFEAVIDGCLKCGIMGVYMLILAMGSAAVMTIIGAREGIIRWEKH